MLEHKAVNNNLLGRLDGWLGEDPYSTAWVALVPSISDLNRPAWPETLEYLRTAQLPDGGWGDPTIYYPHERIISTLAAILALDTWRLSSSDDDRIERSLSALHMYANDSLSNSYQPIGFELLLPRLVEELKVGFASRLPLEKWALFEASTQEKLARIKHLQPNPAVPSTWWVSMEMLPEEQLAELDDSYLDPYGSIATSTAATAAYLRARRRAGHDSFRASYYLSSLIRRGNKSVPFCWPAEVFDRLWSLDVFRRAGFSPKDKFLAPLIDQCQASWGLNTTGMSYSDVFPVADSDHTVVGFTALQWAGRMPSDKTVLNFWDIDHFRTYHDERDASISANIHGLTALRSQPGFPHRNLAKRLTKWLEDRIEGDTLFMDKWHLSPFYPVSRAIPAFLGWNDALANSCLEFLIKHQRSDGGWGWFGHSTVEETAHACLALVSIQKSLLPNKRRILYRGSRFLASATNATTAERLWIGKTLYQPRGIQEALTYAVKYALDKSGYLANAA